MPKPFAKLERYRNALLAHGYRLTGSMSDAEDLTQDALERAWAARASFRQEAALQTWLYRIATHLALDLLRRQKRGARLLPVNGGERMGAGDATPARGEPEAWVTPFPDALLAGAPPPRPDARYDAAESVQLAFITALQRLTPSQRAVLVLRDVLGWSTREVGEALRLKEKAVESSLHRARQAVAHRRPRPSAGLSRGDRLMLERYVRAWENRDVDGLAGLLSNGVLFSMPPNPGWLRGLSDVRAYLARVVMAPGLDRRLRRTRANGVPAFGVYVRAAGQKGPFRPHGVHVVSLTRGRVGEITSFHLPALFPAFGLPTSVR